jgi:hypothetical protein
VNYGWEMVEFLIGYIQMPGLELRGFYLSYIHHQNLANQKALLILYFHNQWRIPVQRHITSWCKQTNNQPTFPISRNLSMWSWMSKECRHKNKILWRTGCYIPPKGVSTLSWWWGLCDCDPESNADGNLTTSRATCW